ncbi:MAG: hypothetical protein M3P85_04060 [Actinomycetota bacterium]|jgi:hypothetical protein|nr:hypothetical protein [Actinomycetota bacterium]
MRLQSLLPWAMRAAWAVLPLTAGPSLGAALSTHSRPVQLVASTASWAAWAGVVTATLIAHPVALTALRTVAPAALLAAAGAAADGQPSALALGSAALALALAFLPETGARYVNGPAYPNERRLPLRVPGPLLLGILPLAWSLAVGLPVAAALLLASGRGVAGGLVAILAVPLARLLLAAMHNLSRRWVVFVPAGLVLHDPISLADPVLFRRQIIEVLRPAPADSDSLDLTQRAPGLALELVLTEKVPMMLMRPGTRIGEPGSSARLLFTPTRPGVVLEEAAARRISTG